MWQIEIVVFLSLELDSPRDPGPQGVLLLGGYGSPNRRGRLQVQSEVRIGIIGIGLFAPLLLNGAVHHTAVQLEFKKKN